MLRGQIESLRFGDLLSGHGCSVSRGKLQTGFYSLFYWLLAYGLWLTSGIAIIAKLTPHRMLTFFLLSLFIHVYIKLMGP